MPEQAGTDSWFERHFDDLSEYAKDRYARDYDEFWRVLHDEEPVASADCS